MTVACYPDAFLEQGTFTDEVAEVIRGITAVGYLKIYVAITCELNPQADLGLVCIYR